MKIFYILLVSILTSLGAQEGFRISVYPNKPILLPTDLFITATPGITNNNISYAQLVNQIGTNILVNTNLAVFCKTIQEMQRLQLRTNCIIITAGRLTSTDEAGGIFYFDKTDVSATNSGTVFAVPYGIATGKATRIITDGQLNIRWFGALGGSGDDRNALQATFNAAQTYNLTVFVPKGNFRINRTMPIFIGTAWFNFASGGKLWFSLPDGYVNPNNTVTEPYSATNVLNSSGNYVTWIYAGAPNYPWNGKTECFTGGLNTVIENANIDFGWGSANVPTGVRPITGVRDDLDEFTYYQGFNQCFGVKFINCNFVNEPGAFIESCSDVVVENSFFGPYGDHTLYSGQDTFGGNTYKNFQFLGNKIYPARPQVSILGNASYVFKTSRDALKFRGCGNIIIANNDINDTNNLIIGVHLEVNDAQPGNIDTANISLNDFHGSLFLDAVSARSNGGFGVNDYRLKNIIIKDNNVYGSCIRFRGASDGFIVTENSSHGIGTFASLIGDPKWTNAMKGMVFSDNYCEASGTTGIYIAGSGEPVLVSGNIFNNTGIPCNTSTHVFTVGNPFDIENVNIFSLACDFDLILENNVSFNYFSWLGDGGYPIYDNSATYVYQNINGIDVYSVVDAGGVLYRNLVTTTGSTPPSANWTTFSQSDGDVYIADNIRSSSSVNASSQNSSYLAYLTGTTNILKMMYHITHKGNVNKNILGNPIGYSLGVVVAESLDSSSYFKTLNTLTINSGGNTGLITGFNSITPLNDFYFNTGGSLDQYLFYTNISNGGEFYVDIGAFSTNGVFDVRIFSGDDPSGTKLALKLKSDGRIYFGAGATPPSIFNQPGLGNPNGIMTAEKGSLFLNTVTTNDLLYVKASGGNTNWYPVYQKDGTKLVLTNLAAPTGTGLGGITGGVWDSTAVVTGFGITNRSGTLSNNIVAGSNITITNGSNGQLTISSMNTNSGTVSSVALSVPTFLAVTGSPITTSGTLAINYSGVALPVANGGTAGTTSATARTALGLNTGYGITNNGNLYSNNITAGANIVITNGIGGQLIIASSGGTNVPSGSGVVTVTGGVFDSPASLIQNDLNGNPGSGGFVRNYLPVLQAALYVTQGGGGVGTDGTYIGYDMGFADEFTFNNQDPVGGGFKWFSQGQQIMDLTKNGVAKFNHITGQLGGTPTVLRGPGAGGFGASVSMGANSSDTAMEITLTTGTTPLANDILFTVTFAQVYDAAPKIVFSPSNLAAARDFAVQGYPTPTTGGFTYNSTSAAMTAGLIYTWTFHVIR